MIEYILLDIEETTVNIDFFDRTLFPYSKEHMLSVAKNHLEENKVQESLVAVQQTVKTEENREILPGEAIQVLEQWLESGREHPALTVLQTLVWEHGFEQGVFRTPLYADVPEAFRYWRDQKVRMGTYSSYPVEAQQLLFKHSEYGDLRHFLSHYFDESIGKKTNPASYEMIAERIRQSPESILFVSDSIEELKAAQKLGINIVQACREPENFQSMMYDMAENFHEIKLSQSHSLLKK